MKKFGIVAGFVLLSLEMMAQRGTTTGVVADTARDEYHVADTLAIEGVNIVSSYARERKTPVSLSLISAQEIQRELGNQEYPEVMKLVPGVYATKEGGGTGDAQLTLRGFKQENKLRAGRRIVSCAEGRFFCHPAKK